MRATSTGRRRALATLAALPLSACAGAGLAVAPDPPPLPTPQEPAGGMLLLLVPGLGLDDVLLGAGQGYLPNFDRALERGALVESIAPTDDTLYTPAEMAQALTEGLDIHVLHAGCRQGDSGLDSEAAETCPAAGTAEAALEAWLQGLSEVLEQAEARLAAPGSLCEVLLLDGLLPLETGFLLAHPEQPGYSAEAALDYANLWQTALRAFDAALGRLLRQIDLAAWTVVVGSTCDAWAVHARLDAAEVLGPTTILAGGAVLQSDGGVVLPEGEAWQQVRVGQDPDGAGRVRLQAPPGYAFADEGDLPRAVPQPAAFLLGLGRGLARGARVASMAPAWAAELLRGLQRGDTELSGESGS